MGRTLFLGSTGKLGREQMRGIRELSPIFLSPQPPFPPDFPHHFFVLCTRYCISPFTPVFPGSPWCVSECTGGELTGLAGAAAKEGLLSRCAHGATTPSRTTELNNGSHIIVCCITPYSIALDVREFGKVWRGKTTVKIQGVCCPICFFFQYFCRVLHQASLSRN